MQYAVLGSGKGSALTALCSAHQKNKLTRLPSLVLAASDAMFQTALELDLNAQRLFGSDHYEAQAEALLKRYKIDYLILAGYMRILSPWFCHKHKRTVNIHPSLLPLYKGMRDLDVHRAVIANKDIKTGPSLHWVTEHLDEGEIIAQKEIKVDTNEPLALKRKVQKAEAALLIDFINQQSKRSI